MRFSDSTLRKAKGLIDGRLGQLRQDEQYANVWWVYSERSGTTYRVQHDFDTATRRLSWITCTCPHGLNVGVGATQCYHAAAVLMTMRDWNVTSTGESSAAGEFMEREPSTTGEVPTP